LEMVWFGNGLVWFGNGLVRL